MICTAKFCPKASSENLVQGTDGLTNCCSILFPPRECRGSKKMYFQTRRNLGERNCRRPKLAKSVIGFIWGTRDRWRSSDRQPSSSTGGYEGVNL